VLLSGGKLCYGGHLDPSGYTSMLVQELQRYSRRDKPLRICLAWQEHRKLTEEQFEAVKADLGLYGEIVCLDPDGKPFTWQPRRMCGPSTISQSL
jgi:SLOG cluster2